MRTLLINLTRFGDLLQSQPLVYELHTQGHVVGVVCLDNFAEAAGLLEHVEAVFPLPGGRFLAALEQDWRVALARVQGLVAEVRARFAPDCVINLTSTSAGRLLTRRLGEGLPTRGFGVDALGFGANGALWTAFFEAASRHRGCSPFNIVDVFRKAAGLGHTAPHNRLRPPDPERLRVLADRPNMAGKALVALQLGASETRRQWPIAHFVAVGHGLSQAGFTPVLVGSPAERRLAQDYAEQAVQAEHVYVDCVGSTDLPELAALLSQSGLLITNDTGTMHLAAGLGTPCVALFLATAQPWDTGPYLIDCVCLEPDMPCHPCGFGTACPCGERCREHIGPEVVLSCALERLCGSFAATSVQGTRVWRSVWGEGLEAGFMDLRSLSGHEAHGRTAWLRLQRYFYRHFLDFCDASGHALTAAGVSSPCLPVPPPLPNPAFAQALPPTDRAALAATLAQAQGLLLLVEQAGRLLLGGTAPPQAGQRFLGAVHRLTALFEEPAPFGGFDALGRLWLSSTQERGDDLPGVLRLAVALRQSLAVWHEALTGAPGSFS